MVELFWKWKQKISSNSVQITRKINYELIRIQRNEKEEWTWCRGDWKSSNLNCHGINREGISVQCIYAAESLSIMYEAFIQGLGTSKTRKKNVCWQLL